MQYRRIEDTHYAEPVAPIYEKDGLLIDANDSVFEKRGLDKYLKIGYLSSNARLVNNVNDQFKGVPYIGLGLALSNIFFPVQGKKDGTTKMIALILEVIIFIAVAYGFIVGCIMNSVYAKYLDDKIIKFSNEHKKARNFFPNYWFTGKLKFYALYEMGLPVFLVLFLLFLPFGDNYNGVANAMIIGNGISGVLGIFSVIVNLIFNLKDHVSNI